MPESVSRKANWKAILFTIFSVAILFQSGTYLTVITASAVSQTVCVLQPIDQSIPLHLVNMTIKVLAQHNETSRYVGLVQELTDKSNTGCDFVIQFQRAVNSNYNWINKQAHYTISGNTITLYTDKTPVLVPNSIGGGPSVGSKGGGGDVIAPIMTNWSCFAEALSTFHQNANGFSGYTTCNPYAGTQTTSDNVPYYIVHKSLEHALGAMHL
ncbi:MAG: hypothetical protein ACREBB_00355 [Nitrosotalea sp.]